VPEHIPAAGYRNADFRLPGGGGYRATNLYANFWVVRRDDKANHKCKHDYRGIARTIASISPAICSLV
jgi:hypothetical protein